MCGNPENRQVSSNRPLVVNSLSAYTVVDIAVGGEHTLALTSNHLVFSWGSNSDGQVVNIGVIFTSMLVYLYIAKLVLKVEAIFAIC